MSWDRLPHGECTNPLITVLLRGAAWLQTTVEVPAGFAIAVLLPPVTFKDFISSATNEGICAPT